MRLKKSDLEKPPLLLPLPEKPLPVAVTEVKSLPVQATEAPAVWGRFSGGLAGFAALREIRTFRTYGFGGFLQYMLPAFFSERNRLFGRLQFTRLVSESYDYFFVPLYAGLHSSIYQVSTAFTFYGELALGLGYLETTRGDVEKDTWKGSLYAALGACYFFTRNISVNMELAGTYITRDQSAGNMLRLQLAAVFHL